MRGLSFFTGGAEVDGGWRGRGSSSLSPPTEPPSSRSAGDTNTHVHAHARTGRLADMARERAPSRLTHAHTRTGADAQSRAQVEKLPSACFSLFLSASLCAEQPSLSQPSGDKNTILSMHTHTHTL